MLPYFREEFGNPSAVYTYGQTAKNTLEKCRNCAAKCLGALSTEIYFTSGGTEGDNWVIRSVCQEKKSQGRHIITTAIEHNAVLRTLEDLEKEGFEVTYLVPDSKGQISAETANLSPAYFSRRFGEVTGVSYKEFLGQCRLKKVCMIFKAESCLSLGLLMRAAFLMSNLLSRRLKRITTRHLNSIKRL